MADWPNGAQPYSTYVVVSAKLFFGGLIVLFIIIPAIVKLNPRILSEIVFLHRVKWPPWLDLTQPKFLGLDHTRHLCLQITDSLSIGMWHVLPHSRGEPDNVTSEAEFSSRLQGDEPIILYLHGRAGTRADWHRIALYKVLANAGFHVVPVDYRGFGDSTGSPSERGVVADSISVYRWIKKQSTRAKVLVWGHSLGSSISTNVVQQLCRAGDSPAGLILEAPFNNLKDAAFNHPFSAIFKLLPWFNFAFVEPLTEQELLFRTDHYIAGVSVPTLILHAEDDCSVPYKLGRQLYDTAKKVKSKGGVEMKRFSRQCGYGHNHLWKAPDLPQTIRSFEKKLC